MHSCWSCSWKIRHWCCSRDVGGTRRRPRCWLICWWHGGHSCWSSSWLICQGCCCRDVGGNRCRPRCWLICWWHGGHSCWSSSWLICQGCCCRDVGGTRCRHRSWLICWWHGWGFSGASAGYSCRASCWLRGFTLESSLDNTTTSRRLALVVVAVAVHTGPSTLHNRVAASRIFRRFYCHCWSGVCAFSLLQSSDKSRFNGSERGKAEFFQEGIVGIQGGFSLFRCSYNANGLLLLLVALWNSVLVVLLLQDGSMLHKVNL